MFLLGACKYSQLQKRSARQLMSGDDSPCLSCRTTYTRLICLKKWRKFDFWCSLVKAEGRPVLWWVPTSEFNWVGFMTSWPSLSYFVIYEEIYYTSWYVCSYKQHCRESICFTEFFCSWCFCYAEIFEIIKYILIEDMENLSWCIYCTGKGYKVIAEAFLFQGTTVWDINQTWGHMEQWRTFPGVAIDD